MKTLPFNVDDLKTVNKNGLSLMEIEHNGEYHVYHVAQSDNYIVVGTVANVGLLPDFYVDKDDTFTLDEQLQTVYELIYESLVNNEELSGHIEY